MSRLRPGRRYATWAPEQIDYWRAAIAREQLRAVEENLIAVDRVLAILAGDPGLVRGQPPEFSPSRLYRLRSAMVERGFEWQRREHEHRRQQARRRIAS